MPLTPRLFLRKKIPCPCHKCTERIMGCHAECKKYKEFKHQRAEEYKKMKATYIHERKIEDYEIKQKIKIKKEK